VIEQCGGVEGGQGDMRARKCARLTSKFFLTDTGTQIQVGVDPSKCIITKLHMDKDRKALLARKGGASGSADEAMQTVS
jgi:hypothetical protein